LLNTGFKRFAGRINLEHQYNDKMKLAAFLTGSQTYANVAPQAIVPNLLFSSPAIPIYDNNGNFVKNTSTDSPYQNPINSLTNQTNQSNTTRVLGNATAEYSIIPGLSAKVLFGLDIVQNKQNRYLPNSTYEGNSSGVLGNGGFAYVGNVNTSSWLNENTLNFNRTFNKIHKVNAVVGLTLQSSITEGVIASNSIFANDDLTYNGLQNGSPTGSTTSSSSIQWALASYLARVNYILSDKYLLTATVRADGSSRFGPNYKYGYFLQLQLDGMCIKRNSSKILNKFQT
jgi:TonB-dependent starch-binding outer membrane protein SusC